MYATNEQLVEVYLHMTGIIAAMLETQATLAGIVVPLAQNLNDEQRAALSAALIDGRRLAATLRESAAELQQAAPQAPSA